MMRTWKTISAMTTVALLCATAVHAQSRYNGFSVVLLLGETQGAAAGDGLPPAPGLRKALADVKDFLPYRNYKTLDTQWLRSGSTRMKGPDDQEYDVEVGDVDQIIPNPLRPKDGVIKVAFKLQEVGAAMNASEEYGRSVQITDMQNQIASLRSRMAENTGAAPGLQEMKGRISQLEKQIRLAKARKLIDSQFEMEPGETVVVGTSKIGGGDKGLVVLLTAVAAGGK
jgi:hypothetical protein